MASLDYDSGLLALQDGSADFIGDVVKTMLVKSTYTPSRDHDFVSDVVAHEADATGYAGGFAGAGRRTLASKTIALDGTNHRIAYDAADPAAWNPIGGATNNTLRWAVTYIEGTNDADSVLITASDLDPVGAVGVATNGGSLTVQFAATGITYQQN